MIVSTKTVTKSLAGKHATKISSLFVPLGTVRIPKSIQFDNTPINKR